jgi:hypothetical protein
MAGLRGFYIQRPTNGAIFFVRVTVGAAGQMLRRPSEPTRVIKKVAHSTFVQKIKKLKVARAR